MSSCLRLFAATLGFVAAVAALSNVQASSSPSPDANVTVTWSSDSSDTTPVTLALFSVDSNQTFPGGLALANNVNPQSNQAAVLFPQVVPGCVSRPRRFLPTPPHRRTPSEPPSIYPFHYIRHPSNYRATEHTTCSAQTPHQASTDAVTPPPLTHFIFI
ncbi:hypothetical protein B0H17DRAFT_349802 [Mycena rosella]|uniref:Uncharacterized protein n=1 Tax=Mycena rosella TaxID=1033263 RepID=A0AAD7CQN9_MYCRO|nr:hypothetical protein B0H17DRAFT_349802 [Mycena rosella]